MGSFFKLVGIILATLLGLVVLTEYRDFTSVTQVAGYPVIDIAQFQPRGWIAIGQVDARGIIVVAQLGFGLVGFVQGGVGLLFGLGQGIVGIAVIAQLGLSLAFFMGQVGVGMQALGQVAHKRRPYLKAMSAELGECLARRSSRRFHRRPALPDRAASRPLPESVPRPAEWPRLGGRRGDGDLALQVGAHRLLVSAGLVTLSWQADDGGHTAVLGVDTGAVVQLSRSRRRRPMGWLRALLRRDPFVHVLHVDLRVPDLGQRVRMQARVPASAVAGLPWLEQAGDTFGTDELASLLSELRACGAALASSDGGADAGPDGPGDDAPRSPRVVFFETLKAALRGPVTAIYLFPWLLVPKLVLRILGEPVGDWITVAYVLLLVVFFALLAAFLTLFPFVGPASDAP